MRPTALLLILCLLLTGCSGDEEMERFFIVTAMAVDWADGQYTLKLEGSADQLDENRSPKAVTHTGKGSNPTQCFLDVQKQTGDYPYVRQADLILLSQSVQGEALAQLIDYLLNENGLRLNARVAVTKGEAGALLEDGNFNSDRILKSVKKGGGTLTSSDIMLRDLVYTLDAEGLEPVLPLTTAEKTEGLAMLRQTQWAGLVEPRLVPAFMMAGGTARGGSLTVTVDGSSCAFRLLDNKARVRTSVENGVVQVTVGIEADFRAGDRLIRDTAVYEGALEQRLRSDLLELLEVFKAAGCDALGFGQDLCRRDPDAWARLAPDWERHFAACAVSVDVRAGIASAGKLRAGSK